MKGKLRKRIPRCLRARHVRMVRKLMCEGLRGGRQRRRKKMAARV
jgi:hypothetical protein